MGVTDGPSPTYEARAVPSTTSSRAASARPNRRRHPIVNVVGDMSTTRKGNINWPFSLSGKENLHYGK